MEKLQVSDGVWTVLDADRINKVLSVGCVGAADPTLTPKNFADLLPTFVPVNSIPRLREHLIFMYDNLEDAFESFDIGSNPADEQFSIDEFETRLFPWGICDRDAQAIFRQLDAIHSSGHISLLLLLCSIEHASSFALLEKKYPTSRLATMDVDDIARKCAPYMVPEDDEDGIIGKSSHEVIVTEETFESLIVYLWPQMDTGEERLPHEEECALSLRVPLFTLQGTTGSTTPRFTLFHAVRVLRVWAHAHSKGGGTHGGGRQRRKRAPMAKVSEGGELAGTIAGSAVQHQSLQLMSGENHVASSSSPKRQLPVLLMSAARENNSGALLLGDQPVSARSMDTSWSVISRPLCAPGVTPTPRDTGGDGPGAAGGSSRRALGAPMLLTGGGTVPRNSAFVPLDMNKFLGN